MEKNCIHVIKCKTETFKSILERLNPAECIYLYILYGCEICIWYNIFNLFFILKRLFVIKQMLSCPKQPLIQDRQSESDLEWRDILKGIKKQWVQNYHSIILCHVLHVRFLPTCCVLLQQVRPLHLRKVLSKVLGF